ncbi:hypothetical protein M405DRAFT_577164 [Rhizopogon salebrosus TDB-379]|nr:hypothetical protein M405DRAFT_577164 [Rhizopogon salebrosus TDB-379]
MSPSLVISRITDHSVSLKYARVSKVKTEIPLKLTRNRPIYPLRIVASRVETQKLIIATPNQATRELTFRSMSQLIQEVDIHIG